MLGIHLAAHVLQQHPGVSEDGIERSAKLVRDARQESRLGRRRVLERQCLTPQQLVLSRELGRRRTHPALELTRGQLQLRVEPLPFDRFGQIVQHRDDGSELGAHGGHADGHGFHRDGAIGLRIG